MRNTRQPIQRILFNSVTASKIGVYGDGKQGRLILQFKELGISLPGDSYTTATTALAASGTLNSNLEVSKTQTDDGLKAAWLVEFNPTKPADLTNWGYGLTIRPKVKLPGVDNNRHDQYQKSYAGTLGGVTETSGYIDDAFVLQAEDDIIKQISLDSGAHNINTIAVQNLSAAPCYAYRAYKCTIDAGNAAKVTITIDGTATTVTLSTASIASAHAINNDTTVKASIKAWAISTTEIMITSRVNGGLFTIADGSGTGTLTIDKRYIMLLAKDQNVKFDVDMNAFFDMNATLTGFHLYEIDTSATAASTFTISVEGTATGNITESDTPATMASNINTALGNASFTNIYASYDAYTSEAYVYSTIDNLRVEFTFAAAAAYSIADSHSFFARYPSLSADDVFRVFANQKGQGSLSAFVYMDQPEQGVDYVCYTLKAKNNRQSALHGASYDTTFTREVFLYVKKSAIDDDIYDIDSPNTQYNVIDEIGTGKTLDTNLEELLEIWAGTLPSTW